jgi:hypothetical protein
MVYEPESFAVDLAGAAGADGVVDVLLVSVVDVLDAPSPDGAAAGVLLSEAALSDPDVPVESPSPAGALEDPSGRLSVL